MLSSFDRPQYAAAAFRRGAAGFLLKVAPTARIVAAVELAAAGGQAIEARHVIAAQSKPALSARELDVVRLVASGLSNDEIGQRLGLSASLSRPT